MESGSKAATKTEYGFGRGAITSNPDGSYTFRDFKGNEGPMAVAKEEIDPATGRKITTFGSGWKLSVDPNNPTVGVQVTTPNGNKMNATVKTSEAGSGASNNAPAAEALPKRGFTENIQPGQMPVAPPPAAPPTNTSPSSRTYPMGNSGDKLVSTYDPIDDKTSYSIEGKDGKLRRLMVESEQSGAVRGSTIVKFRDGSTLYKPPAMSSGDAVFTKPNGDAITLGKPTMDKGGHVAMLQPIEADDGGQYSKMIGENNPDSQPITLPYSTKPDANGNIAMGGHVGGRIQIDIDRLTADSGGAVSKMMGENDPNNQPITLPYSTKPDANGNVAKGGYVAARTEIDLSNPINPGFSLAEHRDAALAATSPLENRIREIAANAYVAKKFDPGNAPA